jgi:four helix bundle protein
MEAPRSAVQIGTMAEGKKHGAEGLRVYALALDLVSDVSVLVANGRVRDTLAKQALRCADSVVLNIGEGGSHFSPGLKLNNYRAARASAGETLGALRIIEREYPAVPVRPSIRRANLVLVMLLKLIKAQEDRRSKASPPAPEPPIRNPPET